MIAKDSPLGRLPRDLDRRQTLFLDGMRHAAEIAALAHGRLVASLTELARRSQKDGPAEIPESFTGVFLDAWAVVDSVDRFRQLLRRMPGAEPKPTKPGEKTFMEHTEPIRELRNAGDHVAERIDHIMKEESAALGVLSWYTAVNPRKGVICSIIPGTIANGEHPVPNPLGRAITPPTDMIVLKAGAREANLSDAMRHLERQVRHLEAAVEQAIREHGAEDRAAGSDVLITMVLEANDETTAPNTEE